MIVPMASAIQTPAGSVEQGDTIALFSPSGQCVGSGTLGTGSLAIVVWADDPFTAKVDGFREGEIPELRVFDVSEEATHVTGVTASYKEGLDPSAGLSAGGIYVIETSEDRGQAWVSEIDAVSTDPFVEVAGVGTGPLWLAGLDEAGLVRWSFDLSTASPNGDDLVIVQADDIAGLASPSEFFGPLGRPGALVLVSGGQSGAPEVGTSTDGLEVDDVVVIGDADAPRGDALLAATNQTVQYVSDAPLSRMEADGLLFSTPSTPGSTNTLPLMDRGPEMVPGAYHLLSFPVLDATGEDLTVDDLAAIGPLVGVAGSPTPQADPNVWMGFDQDGGFVAPSSVDVSLTPGRGIVWTWPVEDGARTAGVLSVDQGRPIDDATSGGAHTVTFAEASPDGNYLVGNPYAYPLRLDGLSVDRGVLQSSLAVWDAEASTYIDLFVDDSTGVDAIPVWAGAVAELSDLADGSVVFSSTSSRVDPTAAPLDSRPATTRRLSFSLSGVLEGGLEVTDRSAHIRFVEGAASGWDVHDASKLLPPSDDYALVAVVGNRDGQPRRQRVLSVMPGSLESTSVSFSSTSGGAFTLAWTGGGDLEGFELIDHEMGKTTRMADLSEYEFVSSGPTAWTNRFEIRPAGAPPVPTSGETGPSQVSVGNPYPNPVVGTATIHVRSTGLADVSADVFDLMGRRVVSADVRSASNGANVHLDATGLAAGLYVAVIRTGDTTSARRFVVAR